MRIILHLFCVAGCAAQTVHGISFEGNTVLSDAFLRDRLTTHIGSAFDRVEWEDDLGRILDAYRTRHYYLASIDSVRQVEATDGIEMRVFLTESRRLRLGRLAIDVREEDPSPMRDILTEDMGDYFEPEIFSRNLHRVQDFLEEQGYPFATVRVRSMDLSGDGILEGVIDIQTGPQGEIGDVQFRGLSSTKPEVLRRELRLATPSRYDRSSVERGVNKIRRLPFIASAGEPEWTIADDSTLRLIIPVIEGSANRVDGVIGYVPRETGRSEKGYFSGLVDMGFSNLGGMGRQLAFRWQKKNQYSQDFLLSYTEPWVGGIPVSVSGRIRQQIQDTLYVDREWGLDAHYALTSEVTVSIGGSMRQLQPSNKTNGFLFSIPTTRLETARMGIAFDSRDNVYNPREGVYYQTTVDVSRKRETFFVEDDGGIDTLTVGGLPIPGQNARRSEIVRRVSFDVEWVRSVHRKIVLFDGVHGALYRSGRRIIPLSEQYRLGGLHDLRGAIEDLYNGTRIGWNNFEIRYLTSPRSRMFVFWDVGHYFRYDPDASGAPVKRSGWPMGYGFGFRIETRLGIFALDYGLGRGDSFSTGKVHFGMTGLF